MISLEKSKKLNLYKNCLKIKAIWGKMLPEALKSCPKCNKSPNVVTLLESLLQGVFFWHPVFLSKLAFASIETDEQEVVGLNPIEMMNKNNRKRCHG